MAITSLDQIIAAYATQQLLPFNKATTTAVIGQIISLWRTIGIPGAGSADPSNSTTGVIPTKATDGAFPFSNPSSGQYTYLARASVASGNTGISWFYDRLWWGGSYTPANGTISNNTTTAITRGSDGEGTELWAEINTALSAVAVTITVTYVNQNGVSGQTATCVLEASAITRRMFKFDLQAGDTGIRQITNIVGNAAPTGSFTLSIIRRIPGEYPNAQGACLFSHNFASLGMPRIYDDACLALAMYSQASSTGVMQGSLTLIQG